LKKQNNIYPVGMKNGRRKSMNDIINIGQKDVMWNYAITFLQTGVGVILLPFILRIFLQETVAIWIVFTTIIALSSLLYFGFNPSFARNIFYMINGAKELKTTNLHVNIKYDYSKNRTDYSKNKNF
jgi:hypothetical protein